MYLLEILLVVVLLALLVAQNVRGIVRGVSLVAFAIALAIVLTSVVSGDARWQMVPAYLLLAILGLLLAKREDVWSALFAARGARYVEPRLVLFRGATQSACGLGQAAMGPFYCPADQNAYIDLAFFQDLHDRFNAPGDFAQAYVIAHEVGHHVQNLLGISSEVRQRQAQASAADANQLSVRQELQADCFAGVWANRAQNITLEEGDVEAALNAASAIGDDRLQRQSGGTVTPDSFTHGSSEQRRRWFSNGPEPRAAAGRSAALSAAPLSPQPGHRAATGDLAFRSRAVGVGLHFRLEREDSRSRTTTDRTGSARTATSIEPHRQTSPASVRLSPAPTVCAAGITSIPRTKPAPSHQARPERAA